MADAKLSAFKSAGGVAEEMRPTAMIVPFALSALRREESPDYWSK
jgi:hypothetical protein